jgi:hypothetical protein
MTPSTSIASVFVDVTEAQVIGYGDDVADVTVEPVGNPGPANTLSIGAVNGGSAAAATLTGVAPAQVLNLTLPTGASAERNRLLNSTFAINQCGLSGVVTLASGQYGHDGLKAGSAGATYSFATVGLDTTITLTAGSLIMPIEAAFIEGGSYTLSHAGTAQARIWQGYGSSGSGAYAAAPFTVQGLAAATQTNVEFSVGTILCPQFEPGGFATPFERTSPAAQLAAARRYLETSYPLNIAPGAPNIGGYEKRVAFSATDFYASTIRFAAPKAGTPAISVYDQNSGAASTLYDATGAAHVAVSGYGVGVSTMGWEASAASGLTAGHIYQFHWIANAQI